MTVKPHAINRSEAFSLVICLDAAKFVLLCPRVCGQFAQKLRQNQTAKKCDKTTSG